MDHPLGRELEAISNWLDAHPELLDEVAADLGAQAERGRAHYGGPNQAENLANPRQIKK